MPLIKSALAAAALGLLVAAAVVVFVTSSASAHEYVKMGKEIGQTNQWDVRLAAPFSREEFDRFTQ